LEKVETEILKKKADIDLTTTNIGQKKTILDICNERIGKITEKIALVNEAIPKEDTRRICEQLIGKCTGIGEKLIDISKNKKDNIISKNNDIHYIQAEINNKSIIMDEFVIRKNECLAQIEKTKNEISDTRETLPKENNANIVLLEELNGLKIEIMNQKERNTNKKSELVEKNTKMMMIINTKTQIEKEISNFEAKNASIHKEITKTSISIQQMMQNELKIPLIKTKDIDCKFINTKKDELTSELHKIKKSLLNHQKSLETSSKSAFDVINMINKIRKDCENMKSENLLISSKTDPKNISNHEISKTIEQRRQQLSDLFKEINNYRISTNDIKGKLQITTNDNKNRFESLDKTIFELSSDIEKHNKSALPQKRLNNRVFSLD